MQLKRDYQRNKGKDKCIHSGSTICCKWSCCGYPWCICLEISEESDSRSIEVRLILRFFFKFMAVLMDLKTQQLLSFSSENLLVLCICECICVRMQDSWEAEIKIEQLPTFNCFESSVSVLACLGLWIC